jgi:hypothetical protein
MEKPDDKGFLSRWSARKSEARSKDAAEPVVAPVQPADEPQEVAELPALPSIDDLTEHSDYTLFLRKGVPDALRKAALRKLWVTEPSVVNYRPLVEYAWHNNEPGFGPLLPTDNVEDMLNRIFGGTPEAPKEPDEVAGTADAETADRSALSAPETAAETPVETGLPVEESAGEPVADLSRRRHGGALPT